jgi:MFS family permease
MLLLGWGLLPPQAVLYATLPGPYTLLICQGLNGISGAVFGVMMTLVAADLTRGTGRFNLTLGVLGVAISIGASLSTFFTGVTAAAFGGKVAYLGLALTGLCGLLLLWLAMPETHPNTVAAPKPTSAEKIGDAGETSSV